MKRKLHFNKIILSLGLLLMSYSSSLSQTITNLTLDADIANRASFTLTNGHGVNSNNVPLHFIASQSGMIYKYQLSSNPTGPFQDINTISITNPPIGDGATESYERNFFVPNTYAPGTYYLRVAGLRLGQFTRFSNIISVELKYDVSIDDLSDTGYVRCQTPAVSYRLATVRNTGNLPQAYDLSLDPNIVPTEQNLASDILSLQGNPINSTPEISPGATYSFLVRVAAIQGTQPGKNNYTALIATAQSDVNISYYEVIHTLTYCGNGNSLPDNPDAPDLIMLKEGPTVWNIGEQMTYTLTLFNNPVTNREAIFPTITDSIPVNLDIVGIYKEPSDTRNISIAFDNITRVLEVTYPTNNQNKFLPGDVIVIYVDVIPNCYVTPEVINTAFASNGAGDSNNENNISSVVTAMQFDTSNQVNWTGNINEDWFECANWDKGLVPNSVISATIPTLADNNPIIDPASPLSPPNGTAEVRDISIMPGKTLNMNNSILEVYGNWTNNGTFSHGNGTVAFVGSNNQQIVDISGAPTFFNLEVNTNNDSKVQVINDQGLFVNNQLNLESGVLRLEGLSQLIQPVGATVIANTGKLWRDQQGQSNMFNYNYWSSPVGNGSVSYTISSAMKDGSDITNPQNIQWIPNATVQVTNNPITVSSRWLYKFESLEPLYANWQKIMPTTTLQAGQGYTMKGSSANPDPNSTQNYIFVGVPFSGSIAHTISGGQKTLLGNPYASALDADEFILHNSGVIDGTLEFWDHFQSTNSHHLDQYMGGYAKYNLTDQIAAVNINGVSSTRTPTRYVPVGQGFFVTAKTGIASNSSIVFNNSQRAFVKEDDPNGMQMLAIPDGGNSSATFEGPVRIRLNMVSAENYRHQVAIGFMQDKATEGIDYGYDAVLRDTDPNQFYFMHPEAKLLIQGVGYFDEDKKYPLGVIAELKGRYTFSIDQIENMSEHTPVYLYDNKRQVYHNLRNSDYLVNLTKGEHNTRFSLRFKNHNLDNDLNAQEMLNSIVVYRQKDQVVIYNPTEQLTVLSASMYNVLGQEVTNWNISNGRESYIELPLRTLASGIYVVQVQTDKGAISKKININ
jgi:hypothetical protein